MIIAFTNIACDKQMHQNPIEKEMANPTAEDILTENPNADIFMLNGVVYKNTENNDWVNEQELL